MNDKKFNQFNLESTNQIIILNNPQVFPKQILLTIFISYTSYYCMTYVVVFVAVRTMNTRTKVVIDRIEMTFLEGTLN